mmetsp:Transcript_89917/g.257129  ORF Transcript_89917/g.257129 Transcript_89917/m.257129 type:complete len:145 (-) Transcript_89917:134-568(-)
MQPSEHCSRAQSHRSAASLHVSPLFTARRDDAHGSPGPVHPSNEPSDRQEVTKLLVKIVEAGAHTTNAAAKAGAQTSDAAARTVLPPFLYNLIASAVDTFGMLGSTAASTAASTASTVASLGSAAGSMVTGAIRNGAATPKKPP